MTLLDKIVIAAAVALGVLIWAASCEGHESRAELFWRMVEPDARPDSFNLYVKISEVPQSVVTVSPPRDDDGVYTTPFPFTLTDVRYSVEVSARYGTRHSGRSTPALHFLIEGHGPHPHPQTPPSIVSATPSSGLGVVMTFEESFTGYMEIQASDDLQNWSTIAQTVLADESDLFLFDPLASILPHRFYRTRTVLSP